MMFQWSKTAKSSRSKINESIVSEKLKANGMCANDDSTEDWKIKKKTVFRSKRNEMNETIFEYDRINFE